ncbi:glycosyltransferase, MGT family [Paenibacillus sophorae]|uniref:Glycosyltransferase, MGT family n=1 Tax=Paenibacillus sophorae TaxID=1333845 RepID=A0A1H8N2Y1_9BACL|nr:macrolide family glycosyltransferase [Paenibacillus sophorae]QWU14814.1 UDP-glucosyltransferase [Paenibacillus sophorae]SEO23843.1 glycosyltransferase, MGT family [Paenibacillus sophorae]
MKKTHIAMINIPAYGHINPTLAVVAELVKRGYKVTYPATENFIPVVKETEVSVLPYHSDSMDLFEQLNHVKQISEAISTHSENLPMRFLEEAISTYYQLEQMYADDLPDLILFDFMALAGKLFAAKHGIDAVRLYSSYANNEHISLLPDVTDEVKNELASKLKAFSEKEGIQGVSFMELFTPEKLNIAFMPRAFQLKGDLFDEHFLFVGPSIGKRSYDESLPIEENNDRPVMLISLGTIFNPWPEFYKMCIEAFRDSGWQVVMSTGSKISPESLGDIPDNFIVRQQIPQLEILPHARLFITHGGMNSTMEALSYGVPLVVIPQMFEQEVTARRVTELGLGQHFLPDEVTVEILQKSVQEVSEDKQLKQHVYDMQKNIQEAGGAKKAAEAIEKFLNESTRHNIHVAH